MISLSGEGIGCLLIGVSLLKKGRSVYLSIDRDKLGEEEFLEGEARIMKNVFGESVVNDCMKSIKGDLSSCVIDTKLLYDNCKYVKLFESKLDICCNKITIIKDKNTKEMLKNLGKRSFNGLSKRNIDIHYTDLRVLHNSLRNELNKH